MSEQKFIKNAKNSQFWGVFEKPEACGQTVLPDRSLLIGQKLVKNGKIQKLFYALGLENMTLKKAQLGLENPKTGSGQCHITHRHL